MNRDGALTSIWQSSNKYYNSSSHFDNIIYDVVVVGAGITGITTALLLQRAGKNCLVVEANNAGFGTTGGTTAHLNTFYDTPFKQIASDFGVANAKLIAQGAKAAITLIKNNVDSFHIDCGFEEKDAYLFSLDEKQNKDLEDIVSSADNAGVTMAFTTENPFPIPHLKTAHIPGQSQFNPVQYLFGIIKTFIEAGGTLFENCRVTGVEEGTILKVNTSAGMIKASNVIYATHIPPGVHLLHLRCAPYRSYVLGVRLKGGVYPDAMGYDMNEPYHYYRTQEIDGQQYLIAGGEDHKTGHEENTEACFLRLENYVRTFFPVEEISFRWSSQYFESADGLPYIGHLTGHGSNMYVATGFGGNGMIYGTLASIILSDILLSGESAYKDLLSPGRIKPIAGFSNFIKEGADVVKELITGLLPVEKINELTAISRGTAKIVKYEGDVMGIYKDDDGRLHAVHTACPHISCTVSWNGAEKSWDCPCHGSRFSYDGQLLTAPAVADLEKITLVSH